MTFTDRKGITPVIAIVLLLMMTVAIAGGAYAWMQGIIGGTQEQANFAQNTELEFLDLQCEESTGSIVFTLQNDGSTTLDASNVDVFLHNISTGELIQANTSVQRSPSDFAPGDLWQDQTVQFQGVSALVNGLEYRVQIEFTNDNSYSVENTCQA